MKKVLIEFCVEPEDLANVVHRLTGLCAETAQSNLVRLLQHCIYDDQDGPQLAGFFEVMSGYSVRVDTSTPRAPYRVWFAPDRCWVDGEFAEYDNALLYADMLNGKN